MTSQELDVLTNEIEQGFQQKSGWDDCRYLLEKLDKSYYKQLITVKNNFYRIVDGYFSNK